MGLPTAQHDLTQSSAHLRTPCVKRKNASLLCYSSKAVGQDSLVEERIFFESDCIKGFFACRHTRVSYVSSHSTPYPKQNVARCGVQLMSRTHCPKAISIWRRATAARGLSPSASDMHTTSPNRVHKVSPPCVKLHSPFFDRNSATSTVHPGQYIYVYIVMNSTLRNLSRPPGTAGADRRQHVTSPCDKVCLISASLNWLGKELRTDKTVVRVF